LVAVVQVQVVVVVLAAIVFLVLFQRLQVAVVVGRLIVQQVQTAVQVAVVLLVRLLALVEQELQARVQTAERVMHQAHHKDNQAVAVVKVESVEQVLCQQQVRVALAQTLGRHGCRLLV
jgi:hypothetical protein